MTRRKRAARLYRDVDVPLWIVITTLWIWLVIGVAVALHFNSYEIPATEANLAGFVSGGFVASLFYLLLACD